jgi:REase_MTES_1575
VFTGRQARQAGWTERTVRRRIAAGRWRRVAGIGLTALPDPDGALRRAWAAQLTWPDAIVGLRVAGAIHGFPVAVADEVEMYGLAARIPSRGLRVRRARVPLDDIEMFGGLLLTTAQRTAVDLLAALDWAACLDLYAWVTTRGVLTHAELGVHARRRFARPGTPQLVRLLGFTRGGAVSVGERLAHDPLTASGIGGWQAGAEIWDGESLVAVVDLLFERARLVVEIDGFRAHSGRESFERDRRRQNQLIRLGYRVLHFTWRDLTEHPDSVVAQIRSMLRSPTG